MLDPACREEIAGRVRVLQIIVAALVAGLLMFLGIVLVLIRQGLGGPTEVTQILPYVALAFAVVAVLVRLIAPNLIVARARRSIAAGTWRVPQPNRPPSHHAQAIQEQLGRFVERTGDAGRLFFVFQTQTIVAGAILEGAAFFALIAYMLSSSPLALVLAIFLILLVAVHFPTRSSVLAWIEHQLRLVDQERQFVR